MVPVDDKEFEEKKIRSVDAARPEHGWPVTFEDGWSFVIPPNSPVEPRAGMVVRQYGKGTGHPVRGLLIDGQEVYYRTPEQEERYGKESLYGKDVADWLARWDRGESIWTVEMGGLGPGYEQAIQILAVEIVRDHMNDRLDTMDDDTWKTFGEAAVKRTDKACKGFSEAQVGAARSLAARIIRLGPVACFTSAPEDCRIQVSKAFPHYERGE